MNEETPNKKQPWFKQKWTPIIPFIMFFVFLFLYITSQNLFINCSKKNYVTCTEIKTEYVFSAPADSFSFDENNNLIIEQYDVIKGDRAAENGIRKAISKRYSGRFIWMFVIEINVLFCFLALIIFAILIYNSFAYKWRVKVLLVSAIFIVSGIVGFRFGFDPQLYMPLIKPVLKETIKIKPGGINEIFNIMNFVNTLTYSTIFLYVCTICAILLPQDENLKNQLNEENENQVRSNIDYGIQTLSNKKDYLQIVLITGAALLVIGVLRMKSVLDWSLTFMTPETAEIAAIFFVNLTAVIGAFFTMLLAATYLPTAFIIQKRAKLLLPNSEALKKHGFTFSFSESLPRILAIAAPLLTGPIAELFKNVALK